MNNAAQSPNVASWTFAEDLIAPSPEVAEMRDEASLAGLTPVSTGVVATLQVLTRAIAAKAVVEVGTLMGASGLSFLEAMATDGVLTSIDVEADNQLPARAAFTKAGFSSSRFRLIAGSPIDVMTVGHELSRRGTLEGVGGTAYLLQAFRFVPTTANACSSCLVNVPRTYRHSGGS